MKNTNRDSTMQEVFCNNSSNSISVETRTRFPHTSLTCCESWLSTTAVTWKLLLKLWTGLRCRRSHTFTVLSSPPTRAAQVIGYRYIVYTCTGQWGKGVDFLTSDLEMAEENFTAAAVVRVKSLKNEMGPLDQ